MLFLLTLYLQNVLGFTPLQAGLAFLPTAVGVIVGAGLTARLLGRLGPRVPMVVGPLLVAAGMLWLSRITPHGSYVVEVLGPLLVLALGLGQVFVSTSTLAISGVDPGSSGLASALLNAGRQLGGSLGIAVMGTIAAQAAGFGTAFEVAGLAALAAVAVSIVATSGTRRGAAEELAEAA
jgi:predicted MFS family arabinose efflux permease